MLNDRGQVAGIAQNGETDPLDPGYPEIRAVLWRGGQIKDLGTFGGSESFGTAINDAGEVTGVALNTIPDPYSEFGQFNQNGNPYQTQTRAFRWKNNKMTDIGTLGGPDAWGAFINKRGWIAGDSYTNDTPNYDTGIPDDYPFLWKPGHGMKNLDTLGGDTIDTDEGLNDKGEVIGSMETAGNQSQHPYLWDGKKLIDLRYVWRAQQRHRLDQRCGRGCRQGRHPRILPARGRVATFLSLEEGCDDENRGCTWNR